MPLYEVAAGSLVELQSQLILAKDLGFITKNQFEELAEKTIEINKMVNSLISKLSKLHSC